MAQELAFEPTSLNREIALKGLTPEEFAVEAEVHVATVYRAIRGGTLKPQSFTRILKALDRLPALAVASDLVKAAS